MGKAGDQGCTVTRLELVEARAVDQSRDHFAHVIGLAGVGGNHPIQFVRRQQRFFGCLHRQRRFRLAPVELGDDRAHPCQCLQIVVGHVVGHAGDARVHIGAAQFLGRHHFTGGRLHQRWATEEDRALFAHDHGLIAHRRHIGTTGGTAAHHAGDLRNALRGQVGLVVEDAAEMIAVREDFVLQRQEGATGIDQVDARQVVLLGNLLRAQVLLHRHRVVGATLDRGVVGHDHAFDATDPTYAGHHARSGHGVVVHAMRGQRRDFQEGAARVKQGVDAITHQQLAACGVLGACGLAATQRGARQGGMQVVNHGLHGRAVAFKGFAARLQLAVEDGHRGGLTGCAGTVRGRSACGGSPKCRRRFHRAWRRATNGRSDIR